MSGKLRRNNPRTHHGQKRDTQRGCARGKPEGQQNQEDIDRKQERLMTQHGDPQCFMVPV